MKLLLLGLAGILVVVGVCSAVPDMVRPDNLLPMVVPDNLPPMVRPANQSVAVVSSASSLDSKNKLIPLGISGLGLFFLALAFILFERGKNE